MADGAMKNALRFRTFCRQPARLLLNNARSFRCEAFSTMRNPPLDEIHSDVERKLRWLFKEVAKLRQENERLQSENEALRRRAAPLQPPGTHDIGAAGEQSGAAPQPAAPFYHWLPPSFTFSTFFELADAHGLGSDEAKRCLLGFIREERLLQKGSRIIKADALGRPARRCTESAAHPATP